MASSSGGWIDKSVEWLIFNNHIKCFDYDDFTDFENIEDGGLGNIRKATWQDFIEKLEQNKDKITQFQLTQDYNSIEQVQNNSLGSTNPGTCYNYEVKKDEHSYYQKLTEMRYLKGKFKIEICHLFEIEAARSLESAKCCINILDFDLSSLRDFGHAYFYEFGAHSPINYLKISTHHKKLWEDRYNKVREYLFKQIRDVVAEKELLDCIDKFLGDNIIRKVKKDRKKSATIPNIRKVIVSKQKDDDRIELIDSVSRGLDAPKEEIIATNKKKKIKKAYNNENHRIRSYL
ncbi:4732_t:CDS:2 [Cetraspora pellucida]|uniref:4732_t:CDS:1 n=1 Tax=Cetraspora pellucida TaxID=1433469 RepID=A0A9N8ZDT4_9GLOM|nr:4732_t:CDS:2 [Cetraspora pellucida]